MEIEYTQNSDAIFEALHDAEIRALETCGLLAEGYAKRICPVDTGNLRNSISHSTDTSEKCTYIGTNVDYAGYVENGTYKQKAQPYIKPAVADHADTYRSTIESIMRNG